MKRSLFIVLGIGLLLISLSLLTTATTSLAQRDTPTPQNGRDTPTPARDTPTPSNGEGKKDDKDDDDDDDAGPPPPMGSVYGYVYNYSSGARSGDVTVVLDGGGWKVEAVTNSEGYYVFAGLGEGSATINLRLPPGVHSVMPDWTVYTSNSDHVPTNLGLYWGDTPPMPVLLSVNEPVVIAPVNQEVNFTVKVNNRSGGVASDATVDFQIPASMTIVAATTSHGEIEFSDHRIWDKLGDLSTGQTATLLIRAKFDEGISPQNLEGQVILTYQEELTPQLVKLEIVAAEAGGQPATSTDTDVSAEVSADQTEETADTTATESEAETLIPTTGNKTSLSPTDWLSVALSIIFILGLSVAGFRAFARRA
jgi:uncharacterized repeat protein (TIGR01451 family)